MTPRYYAWCMPLLLSLCTGLFGVSSCAIKSHQTDSPSTTNMDSLLQQYPREQFVSAIGEGETLAISQQQALLNLGQTFSVRVSGIQQSNNSFESTSSEGREKAIVSRSFGSNIRRQSDQLIQGAEVYPAGEQGNMFRSIAVLEKSKGLRILTNQIDQMDVEIQQNLERAKQSGERRIETISWLSNAISIARIREDRARQITVLGGTTISAIVSRSQLQAQLQQHVDQLIFAITFSPNTSTAEQSVLRDSLALAGLTVTHQPSASDYQLNMQLDTQQSFFRENWYWQTAQLTIQLAHQNQSLGQTNWEFKVAATRADQLTSRLHQRIANDLQGSLLTRLITLTEQ